MVATYIKGEGHQSIAYFAAQLIKIAALLLRFALSRQAHIEIYIYFYCCLLHGHNAH